jgi:hypothetical protein
MRSLRKYMSGRGKAAIRVQIDHSDSLFRKDYIPKIHILPDLMVMRLSCHGLERRNRKRRQ